MIMNSLSQIYAVTAMNFQALRTRAGASLVVFISMAIVVGVTLAVMSLSSGLLVMSQNSTDPRRVLVMSRTSQFEGQSSLDRAAVQAIMDSPAIARDAAGKPIASADVSSFVPLTKKADHLNIFLQVRGVGANYLALHPEIKLVEGRMFEPGLHELVVGTSVRDTIEDTKLGDNVLLQDGTWKVVGVFATDSSANMTLLTDAETMMSAFRRNALNSVTVQIAPGNEAFDAFKASLTTNPQLTVDVTTEAAYVDRTLGNIVGIFRVIGLLVGGMMGLGAVFGALNVMYAAVSKRALEIATLRAIGFGPAPVVVSILAEAMSLAVAGAIVGAILANLVFDGQDQTLANLQFKLAVGPGQFALGIGLALLVGFIGALFPAIRAARLPIVMALQRN